MAGAVFGDVGVHGSVALHIANDVPYVMMINHESHFAWQAQYLVKFKCHFRGRRGTW